jgi:hypothetical protein
MAQEQNISTQLDNLLVTRNFSPEMLDRSGQPSEAEDAKTFTFDYVSGSGKNYGTMVIILDSENDMKVFYGDNLGRAMEGDDKDEFFDFQQHLSKFARMHRWTYSAKDLNQLKHTMQGLAAIQEGLFEGYYGTRKISYTGNPTEARLMIKHNRTLGEADARFRYVESLFIETADNERFKLSFKNLAGGRAMLEHVRQGGNPYDVRGVHIAEIVNEIGTLNRFNRASASRMLEGVTKELVTEAQTYYKSLRENMKRLSSPRGYTAYFETWHPATIDEQQELVEDIKTLFIEQTLDTRIEAALPLLARIQQQGNAMKEAQIFENWINNMSEGTWNLPETPEQLNKLKELMTTELIVGPDATNATEVLYDIVGDDVLFDRLSELAERDPRANVWNDTEVMERLRELGIDLPEPTEPVAQEPALDAAAPVAAAEPAPVAPPVAEQLNKIRKDAGLPVVESILDESGETIDHILNRFKHEVSQFKAGEELDSDLYEALFDYYSDRGDMPYGIAKARTGDPITWVSDKLNGYLGIDEADNMATFVETPLDEVFGMPVVGEAADCNMTTEGNFCPEHGLAECGGMMEMGTVAGGIAPVMGEAGQDPMDHRGAVTDSFYESALARIKSLALLK